MHNLNKQTNSHVNKLHDPNILVLVVKSSIFTLEKISLHKFGIEFNQKFNGYVSIRILVLYDVVRRRTTSYDQVYTCLKEGLICDSLNYTP